MMPISSLEIFADFRDPHAPYDRLTALRALKNDLVGHDQKKAMWIEKGVVPVLSAILFEPLSAEKDPVTPADGAERLPVHRVDRAERDAIHREAVVIIGSLAQAGPAYISSILASDILPALLSMLSSPSSPAVLDLTILQTLHTIADKLPLAYQHGKTQLQRLSTLLYSGDYIHCLLKIFEQTSKSSITQASIALAADIISKTCTEESYKVMLAEAGVLDALASKLASFVVSQGFVIPGAENQIKTAGTLDALPPPAPPSAQLSPLLRAVSVIIEYSQSRAEHLITSPALVTVFPLHNTMQDRMSQRGPWITPLVSAKLSPSNPIDQLLPSVPHPQPPGPLSFPPLGYDRRGIAIAQSPAPSLLDDEPSVGNEPESAMISWLICIARQNSGLLRLMAIRLGAVLFRLGLARKERVAMFGYLLVPLLIQMLDNDYVAPNNSETRENGMASCTERVKEEAPAVLATFLMESRDLQKSAADGGAIRKLSQMLKESFNPIEDSGKPMWSPVPKDTSTNGLPETSLGVAGVSPTLLHRVRVREGVLRALSALSLFKEEYRKAICDNGVISYVIDSLKSYEPGDPSSKVSSLEGNPVPTLLAACAAARSLTRSVSVLRTSLIDAGVASPIFDLVKSHDVEVQIAATAVICNLAMDFSPMKEAIISADMIPTLCEHSRSDNTKLRLESIWALKHIAYNSTNDIKMKILAALEPSWLKQVICEDPTDTTIRQKVEEDLAALGDSEMDISPAPAELSEPQDSAPGNLRNTPEPTVDHRMTDTVMPPKMSLDAFLTNGARQRKLALSGDLDQTKQMRRDDIQVQEQTLDLVRNLICGSGATEMIDYLLQEVTDLFDVLAGKLRPKSQLSRKDSTAKVSPVPTEIICSVTYIMIHIAAGLSRHRQLLIAQTELIELLLPLFQHPSRQVRVNCVWIVINLTFEDDQSDHNSCRERATKLRDLGVLEQLMLLDDDMESDVRERTKTALHLINQLML
ncbi:hypothetical protein LOZ52_003871 [Ophidiomyces ophidiicola]|nr:hypothetical protein LOZ64_003725 [Ophidiomyces ophidiicola]KAI2012447.1 hypothetical protein LOZ49_002641 [Ophidiomyces ophidiicola]KAI2025690.1 hypothetical protein LOZ46_000624 [Ophidiomyces ophidiicola]KAI2042227.1 hypothetical protein LOZ44_006284 [Ophidiomyces ophidiicola]KAI2135236.1 hypothetical protein LOZ29_003977 [Ophidiomyces ophidiicola]